MNEIFVVLYNVFVPFVRLEKNTIIYTQYWICIDLVGPTPHLAKNGCMEVDTDTEYRIGASLIFYTEIFMNIIFDFEFIFCHIFKNMLSI